MSQRFNILIILVILLATTIVSPALARVIRAQWEYSYKENLAGFRLYYNDNQLCETTDISATSINCNLDAPDGEAHFTIAAFFNDNTESPHSSPYSYIFSSSLKAIFSTDVTQGASPLNVYFDATSSTGNIVSFDWLFGDGDKGNGNIISHTFVTPGTYSVQLNVTDLLGATDHQEKTITVLAPNSTNTQPNAIISSSSTVGNAPLTVQFDGSGSTDDGTILSYKWDTGDGGTATGAKITYTYLTPGNYQATLTVTDDGGLTDSATTPVLVGQSIDGGSNKPPKAVIKGSSKKGVSPLTVSFDASSSLDSDGNISRYEWNFGDGSSGTGVKIQHKFNQPAVYSVTLRVTDNLGARSDAEVYYVDVLKPGSLVQPPGRRPMTGLPFIIDLLLKQPILDQPSGNP